MNKRNTIQRSLVLEAIYELKDHPTADEIYENVTEKHSNISKGTVYRNLSLLSHMGEIRKVGVPDSADVYDHNCHDHYHIQCISCERIFDVDMDFISNIESNIRDAHGFEIISHDIVFKGICPECNIEKERTD